MSSLGFRENCAWIFGRKGTTFAFPPPSHTSSRIRIAHEYRQIWSCLWMLWRSHGTDRVLCAVKSICCRHQKVSTHLDDPMFPSMKGLSDTRDTNAFVPRNPAVLLLLWIRPRSFRYIQTRFFVALLSIHRLMRIVTLLPSCLVYRRELNFRCVLRFCLSNR